MPFQGRSVQGVENRQFGGINEQATLINLPIGSALDMDNFETDSTGAIRRRDGYTLSIDLGTTLRYFGSYFSSDGTQVFVAVCDNLFYEATDPAGPWTDRTGSVTLSAVDGPWVGADINGYFVLANGTDAPILHQYGQNAQTLKDASRLEPPTGLAITNMGAAGATIYTYAVTALTARGETLVGNVASTFTGNAALDATNYNLLQWDLRAGAQGYRIYKLSSTSFTLLGSVGGLSNTYTDTGQALSAGGPPTTNTAYNTPTDWDVRPPQGFGTIARGRSQRLMAYYKNRFFASALSTPLDWLTANDAFDNTIYGGKDNRIVAMAPLYDYTVFFSRTNSFVYTGSTYTDFGQSKILNVGCESPQSVVAAGDDLYFWSEFGPNTMSRVQAGQDVQTAKELADPVSGTVHTRSSRSYWAKIVAWNDVRRNRICWAYPNGTDSTVSKGLVFSYDTGGWSRHSLPDIVAAVVDTLRQVYVATSDGKILKLYSGNTDNGTALTASYETGWYDSQSFLNRQIVSLDVITDKSVGAYTLYMDVFFDMQDSATSTHTLTDTTTDGIQVVNQTNQANIHRCYVRGFGRYFKIKFRVDSSNAGPRILGWREEMRSKGYR